MTTFRRVIEKQIDNLEELASIENNEGRWSEEEKYLFAKECFENLLSNEKEIETEELRKFAEWCKIKGYGCYDWGMLIKQYEMESRNESKDMARNIQKMD